MAAIRTPTKAPYGTWNSPLTAKLIADQTISIAEIIVDEVTGTIYHVESRPDQQGRSVLVETRSNKDVFGANWNARTGVQEYGGAAVAIRNGVIFFTDYSTSRLYSVAPGSDPVPVTPDNSNYRYGDFKIHPVHSHLVVSILEDHTKPDPPDVVTTLVLINTQTQAINTVASGVDFYSSPQFSPDGNQLCWIQWSHPNMPWEKSNLILSAIAIDAEGKPTLSNTKSIGPDFDGSFNQPVWTSNETLTYLTDISGFYQPWRYEGGQASAILKAPVPAEYAEPAWFLGASRSAALSSTLLFVSPTKDEVLESALLRVDTGDYIPISSPYVCISQVRAIGDSQIVFNGSTYDQGSSIVLMTLPSNAASASCTTLPTFDILKRTSTTQFGPDTFPVSQSVQLGSEDSPLYVLYSPPTNPDYVGLDGELIPTIFNIHGGPTSAVAPGLNMVASYFTSRGWAWVDVNYRGSSGYGKVYREKLRGEWGVVDVDDSAMSIEELAAKLPIDKNRTAIRGGSAGGFTTLAAFTTKSAATKFTAGTSSYGISNLVTLFSDTHKFESHYLETLIGGTPKTDPERYKKRSPINNVGNVQRPLLILQGVEDHVVPIEQARAMVKQLEDRGIEHEYKEYAGEGHGWRMAATIEDALKREEAWYKKIILNIT